jgi:hypothetical protein
MYIKDDSGKEYHSFHDYEYVDGVYWVLLQPDTRWLQFDTNGQQLGTNKYYTLYFEV